MPEITQKPSFLERFVDFAITRPDHPAVVLEGRSHSYGEVLSLARRLASFIANHKEGARVSIQLPQGAEAFAAMFGSAMAGAVYSPVNVDAPAERWSKAALKFEPEIVVTNDAFAAEARRFANGATLVSTDSLSADELATPLPPHELVYVRFTSGSTGEPKGVMIPFDALSHYADWALSAMQVSPDDRWSQHPNIAFDLSVLDIFGALCGGATLYPITEAKDLLLPAKAIRRHGLTIWNSVRSRVRLDGRNEALRMATMKTPSGGGSVVVVVEGASARSSASGDGPLAHAAIVNARTAARASKRRNGADLLRSPESTT